jgi:hypothetical protein
MNGGYDDDLVLVTKIGVSVKYFICIIIICHHQLN